MIIARVKMAKVCTPKMQAKGTGIAAILAKRESMENFITTMIQFYIEKRIGYGFLNVTKEGFGNIQV